MPCEGGGERREERRGAETHMHTTPRERRRGVTRPAEPRGAARTFSPPSRSESIKLPKNFHPVGVSYRGKPSLAATRSTAPLATLQECAAPCETVVRAIPLPPVARHVGATIMTPANAGVAEIFDALGTAVVVDSNGDEIDLTVPDDPDESEADEDGDHDDQPDETDQAEAAEESDNRNDD